MPAPRDRVLLVRDGSGVEAIRARFGGHAYDLHRHDEWLVGVTERGLQDFFCRGARRVSQPGRVILIEPQEAHDGRAGDPGGFAYSMLYLPGAWMRAGLAGGPDGDPGFRSTLADDPGLGAAIRAARAVLAEPEGRLARDAALDAVLAGLRPHLGRPLRPRPQAGDATVARRARERLQDDPARDIGADALARCAGAADRFQLARAFRAAYGTSPHAFLVQTRLVQARRRLAAGERPAAVAAACGFADQSHLGRWFRRAYGLTPAAYRACCTGVPDTGPRPA
ncbi:HTH-type transcriptional activator RhaS [Methylobacterium crusticola]|uniref:HTH-type transcriptional activator RhaS n=1 Tax=Methylobacterium crusticola TaxID=1697972 RepID=A0ABQ4R2A7_9HYPH|nr:AraC family transcriptional regulator [Methylobacterium crusticola]GJD51557.1 HTH-type transcriptional activator RhaS [Methylobacterium crusticola]